MIVIFIFVFSFNPIFSQKKKKNKDTQNLDHSIAGTLADLKKHRSQSRCSNSPENGSIVTSQSVNSVLSGGQPLNDLSIVSSQDMQNNPNAMMSKFSGITGEVVSDSTRSRKCCVVM